MRAVCGLDVHKDSVYLCILCETGEIFENVYGVLTHQLKDSNYSVHHGSPHAPQQNGELQVCNIGFARCGQRGELNSYNFKHRIYARMYARMRIFQKNPTFPRIEI